MIEALRKLVWVFEFWNEMLVSNVKCKNLLKRSSFRKFLLEFWEERGEKLMTCHLFLENFSWNFMTFGLSSKVKSFWNKLFVSRNSKIIILKLWNCLSEHCFARKMCYCRNLIVFSCLQFADCNIWLRILSYFVEWFCV